MSTALDLLVFAPHPDDAELGLGGTLARLAREGRQVGIVDLTRGEMGTKGTPEQRAAEAAAASGILGLALRENLDLGDGRLVASLEARAAVAAAVRRHAPRMVAIIHPADRHPDHQAAAALVQGAVMWARLPKANVPGDPCYPRRLIYYFIHDVAQPYGVIDISEDYPTKVRAVEAFAGQFKNPDLPRGYRYVGTSDYLRAIETRARYFGEQIGVAYGEAVAVDGPLAITDPLAL